MRRRTPVATRVLLWLEKVTLTAKLQVKWWHKYTMPFFCQGANKPACQSQTRLEVQGFTAHIIQDGTPRVSTKYVKVIS